MKKVIIAMAILSPFNTFSQPYIQMQAGNSYVGLSIGAQAQGGVIVNLGYLLPYNRADKASIVNLSVEKSLYDK